ncbi:hypothetical protein IWX49DRAFT_244640 [Phyllosticta citricarpa]
MAKVSSPWMSIVVLPALLPPPTNSNHPSNHPTPWPAGHPSIHPFTHPTSHFRQVPATTNQPKPRPRPSPCHLFPRKTTLPFHASHPFHLFLSPSLPSLSLSLSRLVSTT